jgi:prepilin-type N-terminal cleavage/methylation domain-containing protein
MTLRRRLAAEGGFSLVEMLIVMLLLSTVLGAIVILFVSGSKAETTAINRFEAQQNARLALDQFRQELHCASAVSSTQSGGGWPSSEIQETLGGSCPFNPNPGTPVYVTWCTSNVSTGRYVLRRLAPVTTAPGNVACSGGVQEADYLTTATVFQCPAQGCPDTTPPTGRRRELHVDFPVVVRQGLSFAGRYELQDDIVLRNTARAS